MNILTRASCVLRNVFLPLSTLRFTLFRLLLLALMAATAIQASAQTTVNLTAGWNLLGNSSSTAFDVTTVFGNQANVSTVWKWTASKSSWAFYTPTIDDGGAVYAASKGYEVLTSVGAGEGFWVNAKTTHTAQLPAGVAVLSGSFQNMAAGWNLIAIGDNKMPKQFNVALNATPPSPGVMPINLTSLWAWDAARLNWYFYAPNLDADGTLPGYISGKGYLNFDCTALSPTTGFWVNVPDTITTISITATTGVGACTTTTVTSTTTTTVPVIRVPIGTDPIVLTAATPPATFAALTPAVPAVAVSIAGPPRVSFSLTYGNDNAIIGLGSRVQNATATVPSYPNLSFSLTKLVPGTNGAPSRWVSYIVTTVPTRNATTGAIIASVPTRPSNDNTGTLVDNGNGTYTYTFYRDITKVKDEVAAATLTAPNFAADLGDLTYDPNLVHRLTIQISGNAPGTGTNTPNGVQVTTGVPMANPLNVTYDFIPATGQQLPGSGRDIVATAKCNECHNKLGFHGGGRNDAKYCVVCHTDQRKYGRSEATTTATGYDALAGTYRINDMAVGNFPIQIHKIHFGANLTKDGYNYGGVPFNEVKFPQDIRNCTKCHDGSASASNRTAQGDNWKSVPSRAACGACHDGINFATGTGTTLADFRTGNAATSFGHIGGAKADDSQCALCHGAADIPVYHIPVTPPNPANALLSSGTNLNTNSAWIAANQNNLPAGAIKVSYEISSVSRNASMQPVMVFRMLQNGVATAFNNPATKTELWDNFIGAPSVYFVFAVPQDGIAAPADFNASASSYLRSLWGGTATGTAAGTLTGPDASGYYTATLTGVTIPVNAVMLTGGLGYTYNVKNALPLTQTNLANYPVAPATGFGLTAGMPNMTGGLIVAAANVSKVAIGYAGRRAIVQSARCNTCHENLGVFTDLAFHAGQRNDASSCSWCHNPNRTSSAWSVDSSYYIHAIHASSKRGTSFTWRAASMTDGYWKLGYPGILKDCESCHVPGSYDFSSAASASALPNRLYRTVATGIFNKTVGTVTTGSTITQTDVGALSISPYVTADNATNYGTGFSYNAATSVATAAAGTTLVSSPIATACFSCHDSALASAHMTQNGGSIYTPRSSALGQTETCMLCHGAGKVADIKTMHAQ